MPGIEHEVHQPEIETLVWELRLILDAELNAGNQIAAIETDGESGPLVVVLAQPFHDGYESIARTTRYNELGRAGQWKSLFVHIPTGQIVSCACGISSKPMK
jgi:hypothetical protein